MLTGLYTTDDYIDALGVLLACSEWSGCAVAWVERSETRDHRVHSPGCTWLQLIFGDRRLDLPQVGGDRQFRGKARFREQLLSLAATLLGFFYDLLQRFQPLIIGLASLGPFAQPLQAPPKTMTATPMQA